MSNNDQFDDLDDFDDFDEISDDIEAVPESSAAEEDWDQFSEDENPESETQDKPSKKVSGKKKSSLVSLLLIGGIVLVGGGFMFLQTAGKGTPAPVPLEEPLIEDQIAEMPNPPSTPPMPSPIAQPQAESETTQQETVAPGVPSFPDTDALQPTEEEAALRMPKAEDILLKSAPETAPGSATQQPSPAPQVIAAPSMQAVPAAPVTSASAAPEISLMMEKIDALSERMELLETKLESYREETPAVNDAASPVGAEQIKALQQAFARLEERIDQGMATRPAPEQERDVVAPRPPVKPVPQILGQNSGTADANEIPVATQKKSAPEATSMIWVLKGAQPGRAMVAKKGETDIQPVEVGDTLPGIGRITAIEYQDGKWSVTGTSGTISQ
jgi:hypothetical protein